MLIIFFIFGLIIGSFLNVVVNRLNLAESIFWGRSHCPHCKKPIAWYDNVPLLSFIILQGRCRDCEKKISWQYPVMEFFTGLVFAMIGYKFFNAADQGTWFLTFYYLATAGFLISILLYDWLYMEIPGALLWTGLTWIITANLILDWTGAGSASYSGSLGILGSFTYSGVLAAVLAFAFFFLLSVLSRERWMGLGDAYLAILLGFFLGWPKIILGVFLAFAVGAIYGLAAIALGRKKLKSQVPFAPFLVVGTLIAMLYGNAILSWYWRMF